MEVMEDFMFDDESSTNDDLCSQQYETQGITVEELLIGCIEARRPLWDSRLPLKDRSKTIRDKLWLEIYSEFGEQDPFSIEYLMKKWRNLRDTYIRLKNEYEAYQPSGSQAKKKKKWALYDAMSFLNETLNYRATTSSLPSPTLQKKNVEISKGQTQSIQDEVNSSVSVESTPKKRRTDNSTEVAIVNALNRVNAPPAISLDVIHVCIKISEILAKMPLIKRTEAELNLLQSAFEFAKEYL